VAQAGDGEIVKKSLAEIENDVLLELIGAHSDYRDRKEELTRLCLSIRDILNSGRSPADQFKLVIGPFQNDFLGPFVIKQPTKRQEAFDEIIGIDA
jgi:hypothetical protein